MGILSQVLSGDVNALITLLYQIPAILIALTLHEVAHGYVALKCGDPTAKMLGRLSLNPLKHLDPIGTIAMFLVGIGWAKPVPVNPRNYRKFRRDDILVSFAGIFVNLCLFLLATVLMIVVQQFLFTPDFFKTEFRDTVTSLRFSFTQRYFLSFKELGTDLVLANNTVSIFSDIGLSEYLRNDWLLYIQRFLMFFSMVNISLAVFNLLPIPPLDGYHLFNDVLFKGRLSLKPQVSRAISFIFIGLFIFGVLDGVLSTVIYGVQDGVVRGLLWIFGVQ